jgi:hypothetical protein
MPKKPLRNKKTMPEKGSRPAYKQTRVTGRAPPQTLARIMKDQGWMQGLKQVRALQQDWVEWLAAALPEELRGAIVNAVQKGNELTVLAVSAGWSTRVRYALAALEPEIKARTPVIAKVTVRVSPTGQSSARRADPIERG